MRTLHLPMFFLIFSTFCCSPQVTRIGFERVNKDIGSDCKIIIKENIDIDESMGEIIGSIKIGDSGFTINCDENEVMEILRLEACAIGADLINITEIKRPDLASSCYRVKADLIKLNSNLSKDKIKSSSDYTEKQITKRVESDKNKQVAMIIGSFLGSFIVSFLLFGGK